MIGLPIIEGLSGVPSPPMHIENFFKFDSNGVTERRNKTHIRH
jgi:hypothetical protein